MAVIQSIDGVLKGVKPHVKAWLYCRVSTLIQIDGYGLQRQQDTVKAFITSYKVPDELGYDIDRENYEVIEDVGRSAYHGNNFTKGELGKFRQKVLDREIISGLLLIENVDRFTRMPEYLSMQEFNNLILRGIDILEVETGTIFSKKIDGSLTKLSVSISRAYSESKRKSNISKRSWANRKRKSLEQGIAINNNTPEWLILHDDKQSYILDEQKIKIINDAFQLYVEGHGATSIINRLNKQKIFINSTGWSTNKFYHLLRNKRLIGFLGDERHYPEVVDPVLFNQVQTLLDGRARQRKKSGTMMRSLFNGIAKCKFCGNGMVCQTMTSSQSYLRCIAERSKTTKCDTAKLIRYKEAEKVLLEHIRNVDWASLQKESSRDAHELNELKIQAAIINGKIEDAQKELVKADDDLIVLLSRVITNRRNELRTLEEKIINLEGNVEEPDVSIIKDLEAIQDQSNIELRQKIYTLLNKTVSTITCARYDIPETIYVFELNYIGTEQKHVVYCTKALEKVIAIYIKKKDDVDLYVTSSFSIEATDKEITLYIPSAIIMEDYATLKNYLELTDANSKIAIWMQTHYDEVLSQAYYR
ncbi:recombinase family protein [Escherichia albertii]|uniref:recombinase family protein n=1 Tax=Escherichia albertii TaxID=208962 RepID=UPI00211A9D71|nr:recombinase family protein [Escherichia albertii]MCQ8982562.1 recombinase family protein [Escherichia albertii]MCQ9013897.1 recombinase family protein [Escherichia albertii]UUL39956.1 recombinase family protein [Escherichia albertii]